MDHSTQSLLLDRNIVHWQFMKDKWCCYPLNYRKMLEIGCDFWPDVSLIESSRWAPLGVCIALAQSLPWSCKQLMLIDRWLLSDCQRQVKMRLTVTEDWQSPHTTVYRSSPTQKTGNFHCRQTGNSDLCFLLFCVHCYLFSFSICFVSLHWRKKQ